MVISPFLLLKSIISGMPPFALPPESHGPAATGTPDQAREYLRGPIFLRSAPVGNLRLHLVEHITGDDGLVGVFHANPFRSRIPGLIFVLERHNGRPVEDVISDIELITQNLFDRRQIPVVPLFFWRVLIKLGIGAIPGVVEPAGGGDLLFHRYPRNFRRAHAVVGQIKYLFHDPLRLWIYYQMALSLRVLHIAQRRMRSPMSVGHTACAQRGFDLFTGLPGVHLIENVQKRGQFALPVEGIHIVIDGNIAHTLAGKVDFRVLTS